MKTTDNQLLIVSNDIMGKSMTYCMPTNLNSKFIRLIIVRKLK